jgi:hypothetical protein
MGKPPYGGNRPQRGFQGKVIKGYLEAIERLTSYLYYHYDLLKRYWIFLKIEN